jgi:hypothetical protein
MARVCKKKMSPQVIVLYLGVNKIKGLERRGNFRANSKKCTGIVLTSGWYCVILYHREAAMVKLVDTLVLGTNANASRFESEWRHFATIIFKSLPSRRDPAGHRHRRFCPDGRYCPPYPSAMTSGMASGDGLRGVPLGKFFDH